MDTAGRPLSMLEKVRADHPVALHGVSLSIGCRPPDGDAAAEEAFTAQRRLYLSRLSALAERIEPFLISDHLCWTGVPGGNLHDLLPAPFTEEALEWIVSQVDAVQGVLGRRIVLENVSSYLTWSASTWREEDFLVEVARRSGCRILLDVNNVYVSARNHGFDARAYLMRSRPISSPRFIWPAIPTWAPTFSTPTPRRSAKRSGTCSPTPSCAFPTSPC